ncbi:MAG: hypothetical protein DHS20C21_21680 [Gemmatimonadota bacterium]|nr:MAG: hypothetical protein DHS20C21_21680 [Gemmatimonadota bacterium]
MAKRPVTTTSYLILEALAAGYGYGFDIMDATGLASGSVYPALRRFERDKLVGAKWERVSTAREEGRPPRRYYKLTARGHGALTEARARYGALGRLTAPPKQA